MTPKQEKILVEKVIRPMVKRMLNEDENSVNYYKSELSKVVIDPVYGAKVKFFSGDKGQDSKHISLNSESVPIIIAWLKTNLKNMPKPS